MLGNKFLSAICESQLFWLLTALAVWLLCVLTLHCYAQEIFTRVQLNVCVHTEMNQPYLHTIDLKLILFTATPPPNIVPYNNIVRSYYSIRAVLKTWYPRIVVNFMFERILGRGRRSCDTNDIACLLEF